MTREREHRVVVRAGPDRTAALLARGYPYLMRQRQRYAAEAVELRLMGRRALCVSGPDGARLFYDTTRMRRAGALPGVVLRTLFGEGAVHALDGDAHRQRKAMFLSLLTPEAAREIAGIADERWTEAARGWETRQRVRLFDEAVAVLGAAICAWAGIPDDRADTSLARDLATIVDGFGSVGASHVRARLARKRANAWAERLVADARSGGVPAAPESALGVIARHRDDDGAPLDESVAAVELLNLLRPTVAVAWFVAYTALALRDRPDWRTRLATGDDAALEAFAHEVRRRYPFVPLLGATARHATEWRGHRLRAGQLVLLDVYGTLHDPSRWPEPDTFAPERFAGVEPDPYAYVPQGGGDPATGHRCPGERVTIELVKGGARFLAGLDYALPRQDLRIPLSRLPTRPRSGVVVQRVARRPAVSTGTPGVPPSP